MKKFLSILLALTMLFSTASFAAPSIAGTVSSVEESDQSHDVTQESVVSAEVAQDGNIYDEKYGLLVARVDFDDLTNKTISNYTKVSHCGYLAPNLPENFPTDISVDRTFYSNEIVTDPANPDNKYLQLTVLSDDKSYEGGTHPGSGWSKFGFAGRSAGNTSFEPFPQGVYTIKGNITTIKEGTRTGAGAANVTWVNTTSSTAANNWNTTTFLLTPRTETSAPAHKGENNYQGCVRNPENSSTTYGTHTVSHSYTFHDGKLYNGRSFNSTYPNGYEFTGFDCIYLMSDVNNTKNFVYTLDNVELYYRPVTKAVSVEYYDLRKGYIDITVEDALFGITANNGASKLLSSSGLFDAHTDIIENEDGTVTYRLYEDAYLLNKTVSLKLDGDVNFADIDKTSHTYKPLDMTKYDGENMVANGDFSNKYYTGVAKSASADVSIDEKGYLFTINNKVAARWNTQSFKEIPLTTAKYFVELDMEHVSTNPENQDGSYSVAIYLPFPDNNGNFSIGGKYYSSPAHIPSSVSLGSPASFNISAKQMNTPKKFSYKRVLDLTGLVDGAEKYNPGRETEKDFPVADLDNIPLSFQYVLDETHFPKDYSKAVGVSFRINHLSFKKMFTASFVDGETVETLDIAKDVEFILPETLGGKKVAQWIDENGNAHDAGSLYTPTAYVEEGIEFTPVYFYVPNNEQKLSFRFSDDNGNDLKGLRFLASVTAEQKIEVAEYGFIVSLQSLLGSKELTHDCGVTYVTGVNYCVVDNEVTVDKIYDSVDDSIFFTAVVYGIPEKKDAYEKPFVVRPYTKVGNDYYYGDVTVSSFLDAVKRARDNNYEDLDESMIEKCKEILELCGESI